jgi:hypothetical protein
VLLPAASRANTALYTVPNCAMAPKSSKRLFTPEPSTVETNPDAFMERTTRFDESAK